MDQFGSGFYSVFMVGDRVGCYLLKRVEKDTGINLAPGLGNGGGLEN